MVHAFRFLFPPSEEHLLALTAPAPAAPSQTSWPGRHAKRARRACERARPRSHRARSWRSRPTRPADSFPRGRRIATLPAAPHFPVFAHQTAQSARANGGRAWSTKTSESLIVAVSFFDPVFRSATTNDLCAPQHSTQGAGTVDLPVCERALPERDRPVGDGHVPQPVRDRTSRVLVDADERVVGDDLERLRRLRRATSAARTSERDGRQRAMFVTSLPSINGDLRTDHIEKCVTYSS
jgi:hypothetical protein